MNEKEFRDQLKKLAFDMAKTEAYAMSREEANETLKEGRFNDWNKHRKQYPMWIPDLSDMNDRADFEGVNLSGIDLSLANLNGANLCDANLSRANLYRAQIGEARLYGVNLSGADCRETNFYSSFLKGADLSKANLTSASFMNAILTEANLNGSILTGAFIYGSSTEDLSIKDVKCDYIHAGQLFEGRLPKDRNFRQGEFERYMGTKIPSADLLNKQIDKNSKKVFVSYIYEDSESVKIIVEKLKEKGISVWLDKERLQPGVRWKQAIRNAIEDGMYFMACFSSNYWNRDKTYMNEELNIAIDQIRLMNTDKIWFIPIRLDSCEIPKWFINANTSLRDFQWVDISTTNMDVGIKRIADIIKMIGE